MKRFLFIISLACLLALPSCGLDEKLADNNVEGETGVLEKNGETILEYSIEYGTGLVNSYLTIRLYSTKNIVVNITLNGEKTVVTEFPYNYKKKLTQTGMYSLAIEVDGLADKYYNGFAVY
ncbi:MAG: hypothetical protein IJU35_00265 [Paludibacteraceae bacterium]|nr:hypothetical protein [Paludibacteraceae bacterium]